MKIDYTAGSFTAEAYAQMERDRHECEVRYVAGLETDAQRAVKIQGVRDERGEAAAKRLRADVWEYMQKNGLVVQPEQEALFG